MVCDRVPDRLGPEPGADVAVKPGQSTQFLLEVERGTGPTFTEGGEGHGTPASGFSEQPVELLGQAPQGRQTCEIVRARGLRWGDDEEKDETREEMRPRRDSTLTKEADSDGGDREEGGDQRRNDPNAREIDLAVRVRRRRRGWSRYRGSR